MKINLVCIFFIGLSLSACKTATTTHNSQNLPEKERITEKYWKLIEINGNPVVANELSGREPHIVLKDEDRRLTGTGGCNQFIGTYELGQGARITFSKVATTQMACPNMETEIAMARVFEAVDNYTLSADGKYLSLNKARMAPLARFELVCLK